MAIIQCEALNRYYYSYNKENLTPESKLKLDELFTKVKKPSSYYVLSDTNRSGLA